MSLLKKMLCRGKSRTDLRLPMNELLELEPDFQSIEDFALTSVQTIAELLGAADVGEQQLEPGTLESAAHLIHELIELQQTCRIMKGRARSHAANLRHQAFNPQVVN